MIHHRTIGANDINFAKCLAREFQALHDPCLAGTINNLQASSALRSGLQQLASNLPAIVTTVRQIFPNAHVYVTTYYQPFPAAVRSGGSACGVYTLPALAAFANQTQGLPWPAVSVAFLQYVKVLPNTAALFQARFARVSAFLLTQLNAAIRSGTQASLATTVALDQAFQAHDICSIDPWVFSLRSTATIAGVTTPNNGAVCNYPDPTSTANGGAK